MSATQELIAAALRLAALAERNTDDRDEWQHAIDSVREACARAMVQPAAPDVVVRPGMEGWKEAAIAWEVCASIHREYAKKKDPFFTTRQSDFVKHAEATRAKALTPEPDMEERDDIKDGLLLLITESLSTYGDAREAAGYARGRAEAGLVLQTNIGGGSCRHGVRLPHECAACADEASDADVAAWMARTALAGEVKP